MDSPIETGNYISYLVYIAGVKVPCQGLNISTDTQSNSVTMSIILPANEILLDLGRSDRVQVAAFYLDIWRYKDNPTWCLLGEGHITGVQYSNTPVKKDIVIQVSSNIAVLDNLYLEFLGGGESSSGKVGKPGGSVPNELTFKGKFPGQLFTVGLDNKTQIRAPYELVQNILLATTGEYKDTEVAKSADTKELDSELARVDSLVKLNYESKVNSMTPPEKEAFDLALKNQLESRASKIDSKIDFSGSIIDIQKAVIRSEVKSILKKRSLNSRTAVSSGFFNRFLNLVKMSKHIIASPVLEGLINIGKEDKKTQSMPTGVFPMLRTSRGSQYLKAIARQSGYKYGDNGSARALIGGLFSILNYSLMEIVAPPCFEGDSRGLAIGKFNEKSTSNYIGSFISKPLTNYSIPPACNVVFPSMRLSLNTTSNYSAMPTRVYYKKSSQGRKLNLDNKTGDGYAHMDSRVGYPASIARHAIDSAKAVRGELEILVFPEEYYLGPKAMYTEINPLLQEIDKIDKAGRLQDETLKITKSSISPGDVGFLRADQAAEYKEAFSSAKSKGQNNYDLYLKQAKIDYDSARSATFQCSVNTVFNPYIVPGYSCIIADQEVVGGHLIGLVAAISHNISASNSSTSITLTSVRRLKSVIEDILEEGAQYDMSPLEPIGEVRAVMQKIEAANFYYANTLYRDGEESTTNDKATVSFFDKLAALRNKQAIAQNELEVLEYKATDKDSSRKDDLTKKIEDYSRQIDALIADQKTSSIPSETKVKAACDYRKLFALEDRYSDPGNTSVIDIEVGKLLKDYTIDSPQDSGTSRRDILKNFTKLKLVYKNSTARTIANSYQASMDYVSRPVCTLEQYIDFYKQSDSPNLSAAIGGRGRGARIKPVYLDKNSSLGKHYEIIREFVGGPGVEPGAKTATSSASLNLTFISEGPNSSAIKSTFATIPPGSRASVTSLPDTVKDWQELLLDYIEDIKRSGVLQ